LPVPVKKRQFITPVNQKLYNMKVTDQKICQIIQMRERSPEGLSKKLNVGRATVKRIIKAKMLQPAPEPEFFDTDKYYHNNLI
jgi:predicted transcriptional regulator